jgi:hypothetical protein
MQVPAWHGVAVAQARGRGWHHRGCGGCLAGKAPAMPLFATTLSPQPPSRCMRARVEVVVWSMEPAATDARGKGVHAR